MKTIGLIGGMSWESSAHYYRIVNRTVRDRLGAPHSARTLMLSVDFADIAAAQHASNWDTLAVTMADAARQLERGGADVIVLCTNTMHKVADAIEAAVATPLLHIVDPTATAIRARGLTRIGLLGTAFTMEQDFYRTRLKQAGVDVLIPDARDRAIVHDIIYRELVAGVIRPESRDAYRGVIARLAERGAQGVILGCTEIGLLVDADDSTVPLFDTTELHARAAVDWALTA